jgi:hypothetical protein
VNWFLHVGLARGTESRCTRIVPFRGHDHHSPSGDAPDCTSVASANFAGRVWGKNRTQNAHKNCFSCPPCPFCPLWNQQVAENTGRRIVQLRPWPPCFQALASFRTSIVSQDVPIPFGRSAGLSQSGAVKEGSLGFSRHAVQLVVSGILFPIVGDGQRLAQRRAPPILLHSRKI